jgi:hypothetical protein
MPPQAQGTRLSRPLARNELWWLQLDIRIERIKPGHPERNGRHERMCLTPEERSDQAGGAQPLPAAGQVR